MVTLIGIVAIILIIAFFQKFVQGIVGALIFGFIGSLFGPKGTKIGAVLGFVWGLSLNEKADKEKEETDKATNKKSEEPRKSSQENKANDSKIIRCPYCKKKIRIRIPVRNRNGKCPACSGSFTIKEDNRGKIKVDKKESTYKKTSTSSRESFSIDDNYKILGVTAASTPDEVRTAYKMKIREYHPDRVAGLGEKLKKMADEESKKINKAYSELKAKGLAK